MPSGALCASRATTYADFIAEVRSGWSRPLVTREYFSSLRWKMSLRVLSFIAQYREIAQFRGEPIHAMLDGRWVLLDPVGTLADLAASPVRPSRVLRVRAASIELPRCRRVMTRETIEATLKELLIRALRIEDMTPDQLSADQRLLDGEIEIDSIDILQLILEIEKSLRDQAGDRRVRPRRVGDDQDAGGRHRGQDAGARPEPRARAAARSAGRQPRESEARGLARCEPLSAQRAPDTGSSWSRPTTCPGGWEALVPHEVHVLPIGLMYVAAAAQASGAVDEVRVVESSLDCPTDAAFVELLDDFKPDVVGIRSIVFFVEELQRLARLTRAHCGAAIVVGGPIVEAWKEKLFEQVPEVDLAVKGDGERVFPELLQGRGARDDPRGPLP